MYATLIPSLVHGRCGASAAWQLLDCDDVVSKLLEHRSMDSRVDHRSASRGGYGETPGSTCGCPPRHRGLVDRVTVSSRRSARQAFRSLFVYMSATSGFRGPESACGTTARDFVCVIACRLYSSWAAVRYRAHHCPQTVENSVALDLKRKKATCESLEYRERPADHTVTSRGE